MKKNNILYLIIYSLLALLLITGCDAPTPESGGARIEQMAQLNNFKEGKASVVSASRATAISLKEADQLSHSFDLTISLYKPAATNLTAQVAVSEEAAKAFQSKQGTSYPLLPADMIVLPEQIEIKVGSISSDMFQVTAQLTEQIPMNTPHLFAIELKSVKGSLFAQSGKVAYFTIERYQETPSVNKVIRLSRQDYLEPDNQFPHSTYTLTMEALVYVEKFRSQEDPGEAQISTLMGVEGATLLRFGDAGVPGNNLQAAGQHIPFTFQENKWYHIAFTAENNRVTVYVNGEEVQSFFKSASLTGNNRWYIGRSWSDARGLQGRLAEVRVWNVARTKAQIADNMYMVKANEPGLLAYWKMNEVKDGKIPDLTGHGYNLTQKGQAGKQGVQEPNILTLDDAVDVSL